MTRRLQPGANPSNLTHTRYMGAYLATLAMPDAICFLHTGEGCKVKTSIHQIYHDWFREAHNSQIWTDTKEVELIQGGAERMKGFVKTWLVRRKPEAAFILTTSFVEMTGEDFTQAALEVDKEVVPLVRHIPASGFDGDLYDGYRSVIRAVVDATDWTAEPVAKKVNIIGHFFDRYEADRRADVKALRLLLEGIGVDVGGIFLSGEPVTDLLKAGDAAANIVLPYCWDDADWLEARTGRPSIRVGLPIGLQATTGFLHAVGQGASVHRSQVDRFVEDALGAVVPVIHMLTSRISEPDAVRTFALFADTPLAAGLTGALRDFGLQDVVVGLMDRSLGGEERFTEQLSGCDPTDLPAPELLLAPGRDAVFQAVEGSNPRPDLLLGSGVELIDALKLGIPSLEVGYPSYLKHGLVESPLFGFEGAVHLAQRVLNGLSGVF